MLRLFRWFKIVMVTVLLLQHGFTIAEPVNCEEHLNEQANAHIVMSSDSMHYQPVGTAKKHDSETHHDSSGIHSDNKCEKCKGDDCACCKSGFCASFHFFAFVTQYSELTNTSFISENTAKPALSSPISGIHLLPYRPPIIG